MAGLHIRLYCCRCQHCSKCRDVSYLRTVCLLYTPVSDFARRLSDYSFCWLAVCLLFLVLGLCLHRQAQTLACCLPLHGAPRCPVFVHTCTAVARLGRQGWCRVWFLTMASWLCIGVLAIIL